MSQPDVVYILDEANGIYTSFGRTRVPIVVYIGPFDSVTEAATYLTELAQFDKGQDLPEGYAIIKLRQPLEGWQSIKAPAHFKFEKLGRPAIFDKLARYRQVAKRKKK